jgi:hypothetical protein
MLVIWENSVNFTMGVWVLVRTLKITRKGNTQLPIFIQNLFWTDVINALKFENRLQLFKFSQGKIKLEG